MEKQRINSLLFHLLSLCSLFYLNPAHWPVSNFILHLALRLFDRRFWVAANS
jgi:hypothetical protein